MQDEPVEDQHPGQFLGIDRVMRLVARREPRESRDQSPNHGGVNPRRRAGGDDRRGVTRRRPPEPDL